MNTFKVFGLLITLIFSSYNTVHAQWDTSKDVDQMTGEGSSYAHSPSAYPNDSMDFPYDDVRAWLGIGCNGESEWAYIGFNKDPNLRDTETNDGYDQIPTRIKWDEDIRQATFTQDWGAKFLHFTSDFLHISRIKNYNTLLVELNWYGEGQVYFEFSLKGSSKALNKIRSECENYK